MKFNSIQLVGLNTLSIEFTKLPGKIVVLFNDMKKVQGKKQDILKLKVM
jgi:hypothetical protein